MASRTEFDVLQQALRDPWSESSDPEDTGRNRRKPAYRWRDEMAAERVRRFFREGPRRLTSSIEPIA